MAYDRRPDPLQLRLLTKSMRRMADLRFDDITRGLENFANPSARGMLDSLGRTREEQVEGLAAMLRNSSEADIAEMGEIFGLAMARLAEERTARPAPVSATVAPRRRRDHNAAEWRKQRKLLR